MFCEKCGAKNDSSSKFCEKCGAKLDNDVVETKKTKTTTKKTTTAKKTAATKEEPKVQEKTSSLSKKQKFVGGFIIVALILCVVLYKVGENMTSKETIASKAFEQLSSKKEIDDKYLSVSLDSDDYFVSLKDQIESILKDEDMSLKYSSYETAEKDGNIILRYRDKGNEEKYLVTFEFDKDGKSMMLYDKYIITKITIENADGGAAKKLYDPSNTSKITIKAFKDSKITLGSKKIKSSYLDKKKSSKTEDVYVIRGVSNGTYKVGYSLGDLKFEKSIYVYARNDNEFDLTDYISLSYLKGDNEEFAKQFKKYITKYYEYVKDEEKTVDDFAKEYKVTDDIKTAFTKSKENDYYTSIKIGDVKINSLYYDSSDKELTISYKVNYTYTTTYTESERTTYDSVRVTYDLNNLELPTSLSYLPY